MLEELPCLDEKYRPQVTFLGPRDERLKKSGIYKHLYKMDTNIAYDWLRVWVDAKHPCFQNCTIDTSDSVYSLTGCESLCHDGVSTHRPVLSPNLEAALNKIKVLPQ